MEPRVSGQVLQEADPKRELGMPKTHWGLIPTRRAGVKQGWAGCSFQPDADLAVSMSPPGSCRAMIIIPGPASGLLGEALAVPEAMQSLLTERTT